MLFQQRNTYILWQLSTTWFNTPLWLCIGGSRCLKICTTNFFWPVVHCRCSGLVGEMIAIKSIVVGSEYLNFLWILGHGHCMVGAITGLEITYYSYLFDSFDIFPDEFVFVWFLGFISSILHILTGSHLRYEREKVNCDELSTKQQFCIYNPTSKKVEILNTVLFTWNNHVSPSSVANLNKNMLNIGKTCHFNDIISSISEHQFPTMEGM